MASDLTLKKIQLKNIFFATKIYIVTKCVTSLMYTIPTEKNNNLASIFKLILSVP